jgi:hypothetical protein
MSLTRHFLDCPRDAYKVPERQWAGDAGPLQVELSAGDAPHDKSVSIPPAQNIFASRNLNKRVIDPA